MTLAFVVPETGEIVDEVRVSAIIDRGNGYIKIEDYLSRPTTLKLSELAAIMVLLRDAE